MKNNYENHKEKTEYLFVAFEEKLKSREKQINMIKSTLNYIIFQKHMNEYPYIEIPDINQTECSRRAWTGQLKKFIKYLSIFRPNSNEDHLYYSTNYPEPYQRYLNNQQSPKSEINIIEHKSTNKKLFLKKTKGYIFDNINESDHLLHFFDPQFKKTDGVSMEFNQRFNIKKKIKIDHTSPPGDCHVITDLSNIDKKRFVFCIFSLNNNHFAYSFEVLISSFHILKKSILKIKESQNIEIKSISFTKFNYGSFFNLNFKKLLKILFDIFSDMDIKFYMYLFQDKIL
jgi:hypothetical protein